MAETIAVGETLACPSAQPGMADLQVLGLVEHGPEGPRIAYLNARLPADEDLLARAAPAPPTAVFRLSGTCETRKCQHFDGKDCQLAVRIVARLPEVVSSLPPCNIRRSCRWFAQEGGAACKRCPQISTTDDGSHAELAAIALPPTGKSHGDAPTASDPKL
ncbi:hypothetical protein [Kaistia algarum]|uniref:hypothetical protein n=1 Tax=Kaistia algarum TaxID=2083279 RepID=UPI001A9CAA51|nr:hypothetical protein [Kaistia algarum]MCX5512483.1 hypothetical protein [Kaistia algarum]